MQLNLFAGTLPLTVEELGVGAKTYLLLHGGAGPGSMMGLAAMLSKTARVLVPTHPGFMGTPRPERFNRVEDLVLAYLAMLDAIDAKNVTVLGNSFGGWLAAELALRSPARVHDIVLLNAVGIDPGPEGKPIVDPTKVPPPELIKLSFHDPSRAPKPSPEIARHFPENQRTLRIYAGETLGDPSLHARLAGVKVPARVMWGESDRICDPGYGRRFAAAIPGATYQPIADAGHLPQIERPEEVARLLA
jgi:pimeloyl-ACP methyl ester carboxylesterase